MLCFLRAAFVFLPNPHRNCALQKAYQTPKDIAHWLNKEREGRDNEPDPVFPGLCSSDEEQ
jgi:hypothetical protein